MIHTLLLLPLLPTLQEDPLALTPRVLHTLAAPAPGIRFGAALAAAGDIDRDGVPDLIVGSPRSNVFGPDAGNVRIYSGADGELLRELQGQPGTQFGFAVASVGDIDRDGTPEILIGAPFKDGFATLFSGASGGFLFTLRGGLGARFGQALSAAGDVDGDGIGDVLVGEPEDDSAGHNAGRALVYSGRDGALLHELRGSAPFDFYGTQLAPVGDLNQDGRADFAVAAPLQDASGEGGSGFNAGVVHIVSGADGATLQLIAGQNMGDRLGSQMQSGADADDDGLRDLALGLPGADQPGGPFDVGGVELRSTSDGSLIARAFGSTPGGFAEVVAAPTDWNDDGVIDITLGLPSALGDRGQVLILSGVDGAPLARIDGETDLGWFGASLARSPDIDGDGSPELLVGAPGHDDFLDVVGSVQIISFQANGPRLRRSNSPPETTEQERAAH